MPKRELPRYAAAKNTHIGILTVQHYGSPCGEIILGATGGELCLCDWNGKDCAVKNLRRIVTTLNAELREESSPVLERTKAQLDEYFAGRRKTFDIPLRPIGTAFQKRVWRALLEIPYGETWTYKEIARRAGNVKAVRAVAQAIGANGICIIVPCHRVIGSDGFLTGFAGGLDVKKALLDAEGRTKTLADFGFIPDI